MVEQFELKQKEALLEQENEPNLRELEHEAIAKILSPLNLQVHEIRPDGHCLYSSISHQLLADSEKKSYQELRAICASEMRRNESEFMPFMVDEDGKSMDHEQYLDYCDKIENTAVWGGQYELLALSNALEREIKIYQADMPVSVMGEQFKEKKPLLIS